MSWGATPAWVLRDLYEQHLARAACAFLEEWYAGFSRELPAHVVQSILREQASETQS